MSAKVFVCCLYCGRDTTARSGICGACIQGSRLSKDEQRGRPARSTLMLSHAEDDDATEFSTDEQYHGSRMDDE